MFPAESQAFFVLFDKLMPSEGTVSEAALAKSKRCYRDICRKMHRDTTEFLAQLLLIVEGSDQRIGHRLQAIGFAPPAQPSPHMQVGPFLFMGAMMIFGMLGVVAVLSPQHSKCCRPRSAPSSLGQRARLAFLPHIAEDPLEQLPAGRARQSSLLGLARLGCSGRGHIAAGRTRRLRHCAWRRHRPSGFRGCQ